MAGQSVFVSIDANYDEEMKKLFDDPSKGLDMSSALVETRNRSTKLYATGLSGAWQIFEHHQEREQFRWL